MRHRFVTLTFFACGLASWIVGCSPAVDSESESDELSGGGAALEKGDFSQSIDKAFIAGTHTFPRAVFETKWNASRSKSALMFSRAYPAAYHKDFAVNLTAAGKEKIPQGVGLCVGDGHPENFGFLEIDSKVIFGFNDLDDSGYCPVAIDALRYVAEVHLYFGKPELTERVARHYVEVLSGERTEADARADIAKVRDKLAPKFDAARHEDKLDGMVKNGLLHGDGLEPVTDKTRTDVTRTLVGAMPNATVVDVAMMARDGGGSGGLARYWVLVRRGSVETVVELKEADKPAVDFGLSARPLALDKRLPLLKREFWNTTSESDYFYVSTLGKTFLVRDRLAKAAVDLEKIDKNDLENVLDAQAAILGMLHKPTAKLDASESKGRKKWLVASADVIAERWEEAFKK